MVSISNRSVAALSACLIVLAIPGAPASGRPPVVLPGPTGWLAELRTSALSTADFDGDGMPDLAVGYAGAAAGAVVLHRGNVDALFPNSPEARQRRDTAAFVGDAFLPGARTVDLPFAVDFLGAGDFDNDGRADLVAGTRDGISLHFLIGDGAGGLSPAIEIPLGGRLVAMAVGDVNRADGVPDLVVSVAEPTGPALLVFESPGGAVHARPETIRVPEQPTLLELAPIRGRRLVNIVAAASSELLVVEGRDRQLLLDAPWKPEVAPPRLQHLTLPSRIESLAWGNFLSEPDPRKELAVATSAGELLFFDLEPDNGTVVLKSIESHQLLASGSTVVPARVSGRATEDLLILDAAGGPVQIMSGLGRAGSLADGEEPPRAEIADLQAWAYPSVGGRTHAVLLMRLNTDARPDLVLLQEGLPGPLLAVTAPQSMITVNSNLDVTTAGDGLCTLREAINNANANAQTTAGDCAAGAGLDSIAFAIGGGEFVASIAVAAPALPAITNSVVIDGTTQGCPAPPCIELNGSGAGASVIGLRLTGAGGNTVRGLVVNRFTSHGIYAPTSANVIEGNRFGTDTTGMLARGNGAAGIRLDGTGATSNTIGGTVVAARNLVSGNSVSGIVLINGPAENTVLGNHVGIDATGSSAIPQGAFGILLQGVGTASNTVGGTTPGAGNVTSGNTSAGICLRDGPTSNTVQGNLSGVDPTGSTALGNGTSGIFVSDSSFNLIGGTTPDARNVVSGNVQYGIRLDGGSNGNTVSGNYVGTDVAGTTGIGNALAGILLYGASSNTIGGTTPEARNVASGNNSGVFLSNASNGNQIAGNYIGIDATGSMAIPNRLQGIEVENSTGNIIGPQNVVSGNETIGDPNVGYGILLYTGADSNSVIGNYVGTDPTGTVAIGNRRAGIRLEGASNNVVGGTTPETRNVSSGNSRNGVSLIWSANNNQVLGNYLGVDVTGTLAIPNGGDGAEIQDATGNTIGPGNVISGNAEVGVFLEANAVGNTVRGNYVGTDATGTTAIGNGRNGIQVGCAPSSSCGEGVATSNVIGGVTSDARNVIVGSGSDGVFLMNGSDDNVVKGNSIGTDATGTLTLGNNGHGVRVLDSTGVRIGGSSAGEGNLIVYNDGAGVVIEGTSMDVSVLGNAIGGNGLLGIDLGSSDGVTANDPGDADAGPNGLQNFPFLTSAQPSPSGVVVVAGILDSTPGSSCRIEFFSNGSCDASGHGEGGRYLGFTNVITDGSGAASFDVLLTAPVQPGEAVVATATSAVDGTSEFSACIAASCSSLAVLPYTVLASDKDHLSWGSPIDVRWVRGDLSAIGSYSTLAYGELLAAPGLDISADQPPPQFGLYYLVRPLICGSWQSSPGGEAGRDTSLP